MDNELILVIDFGGQYNQLIARRVREHNIYCEVISYKTPVEEIKERNPKGIIFTGGPNSVYLGDAPRMPKEIFEIGVPILGICYGIHFMVYGLGGIIGKANENAAAEFGRTDCEFDLSCPVFEGLKEKSVVWMSHNDYIEKLPEGFKAAGHSDKCPFAAIADDTRKFYGVQFHPEVNHTEEGKGMLGNFLYKVCGCKGDWTMSNYAKTAIAQIRALLSKAVGDQLTCVFVDHGFMRKNEGDEVEAAFRDWNVNFVRVDASDRFIGKLEGVSDPETKRKTIGEEFIRVFEEEAKKIGKVDYLVQGTIYPDVIESGLGDAAVIKSHHNVGGLPDCVDFKEIIEPLRLLFKDEVRKLGTELGLADYLVWRQPFPGPGLAIRIMGEITREKLAILQDADLIFREEIAAAGLDRSINQYFAVLTNMRSVGVMGDDRTYDYALALRGVTTTDFMTADFARIPYEVLEKVSVRVVNEVKHINRVVYDVTSKPPATIEFE